MSEPAETLQNTSTVLAKKSDSFFKIEIPQLVDLEKGLNFFKGQCTVHVANRLIRRQKAYELIHDLYCQMGIAQKKNSNLRRTNSPF